MIIAPVSPISRPLSLDSLDEEGTLRVYPRLKFSAVNAIDINRQVFDAEVTIALTWRDEAVVASMKTDEFREQCAIHGTMEEMRRRTWHPGLMVTNMAESLQPPEWWFRVTPAGLVTFVCRLHCTLRERFELKRFPFDVQWLTVRLVPAFEFVRFVERWPFETQQPQAPPPDHIRMHGFILEEWHCFAVVCVQGRLSKSTASDSGAVYQELNAKILLRRKPCGSPRLGPAAPDRRPTAPLCAFTSDHTTDSFRPAPLLRDYYLWNIAFYDFMLVLISLTVLLVPPEEFADRMAMSLTLLLTAVAFKQVVSTHLPAISYQTLLDQYVLCGFFMQVCAAVPRRWRAAEAAAVDLCVTLSGVRTSTVKTWVSCRPTCEGLWTRASVGGARAAQIHALLPRAARREVRRRVCPHPCLPAYSAGPGGLPECGRQVRGRSSGPRRGERAWRPRSGRLRWVGPLCLPRGVPALLLLPRAASRRHRRR